MVFERFTERARHVMVLAQEESRLLDHAYIGTEHLLVGVAREGTGPAAALLERHGLTPEGLRSHLTRGTAYGVGSVPFTPGAKRVLERALREALDLSHRDIEPEHLLLALTDDVPDDVGVGAGPTLRAAGADPAVLHAELLGSLPRGTSRRRRLLPGREAWTGPTRQAAGTALAKPAPAGPICPACAEPLRLGVAVVNAENLEGAAAADVVHVHVVYCQGCGAAIGTIST